MSAEGIGRVLPHIERRRATVQDEIRAAEAQLAALREEAEQIDRFEAALTDALRAEAALESES